MRKNYSFRKRMLFSFWIVLLLALLLPPWYYYRILAREILDETQTTAVQQLNLVHWLIAGEGDFQTLENLNEWLVEAGKQLGVRITYVAEGGKVIADSHVPFDEIPSMDNHASRPEIVDARDREVGAVVRFSRTSQNELIYTARAIHGKGIVPSGVLRLAAPLSKAKEPLNRLENGFLFFIGLVFAAAAFLSYALIRRLNNPIRAMIDTAEAISTKDFKRRIHSTPGQEFYPLTQSINKMAEGIETQIQTITEQKQEIEAIFNAMQEGVMVLDSRGKIRSVNKAFSRLTSNVTDTIGRRPLEVIVNVDLQKLCEGILASTAKDVDEQPHKLQIVLGEDRTYDVNIVRLPDRQREVGAVVVFHDISELKRLEKVRQDFVANVSHELRTPLTSIKGYAETLLSDSQPGPQMASSFLQVILRNANHMVKMVEDLLQLARLEAHQKSFNPLPVNASSALLTAWKACAHHAGVKGLRLENNFPDSGVWVSADFDQLVQVFRNLLENGIRYSPPDEALTIAYEQNAESVTFSVRDEGPGISRQHQQRIFERFYRVEKHRGDQSGSTGLGLAICRHIVRNHGGKIWVQSPNQGKTRGTTFYFNLPKASVEKASEGTNGS
jgi:two-component system phosphate regulon sensor histidine kinase PhoR